MGVKRRRTKLIEVNDDLRVRKFFLAYGRDEDDEIKVIIQDGAIVAVTIRNSPSLPALSDLLCEVPATDKITFIWRWLGDQYKIRTEKETTTMDTYLRSSDDFLCKGNQEAGCKECSHFALGAMTPKHLLKVPARRAKECSLFFKGDIND